MLTFVETPCIGCEDDRINDPSPIRLRVLVADQWHDVNVCRDCALRLSTEDVRWLTEAREKESRRGADDRRRGFDSFPSPPSTAEDLANA